jgi:hypothetical protein
MALAICRIFSGLLIRTNNSEEESALGGLNALQRVGFRECVASISTRAELRPYGAFPSKSAAKLVERLISTESPLALIEKAAQTGENRVKDRYEATFRAQIM